MASIADRLGINLALFTDGGSYTFTVHAQRQIQAKGFDRAAVLEAANNPAHSYENGRYPGQYRHIKGNVCAVVDREKRHIVTVYVNTEVTALRADQVRNRDAVQRADALAFETRRQAGVYASAR